MLNHEQLAEEWEKDSHINETMLMQSMTDHPLKHSKYLTILQGYKVQLRKQTLKYAKLRNTKMRYYNGELTKEELQERGWQQYLFKKPLKSEMESLLDADEDLQVLQEQTLYIETLVQSAEMIMRDINQRYFLFKSMVDYQKFLAGA